MQTRGMRKRAAASQERKGSTGDQIQADDGGAVDKPNHLVRHSNKDIEQLRAQQRKQRSKIVLWRKPITTLHYFSRELLYELHKLTVGVLKHRVKVTLSVVMVIVFLLSYYLDGPHQTYVSSIERKILWCSYWVGLGILSSIGLGTGLHTFLLYLGPHIASVTLAAFTCNSVDFPEPPYPLDIICPEEEYPNGMTFWTIMSKVRLEAFMWGVGTAIGELPPYFMARASRLSGNEDEDPDYEQIEAVLHSQKKDPLTMAKKALHRLVKRVGFFGILLCASIPNPLFDLAGITCGHFLIPFWTFFGATVIGKAVIKMHIQKIFVILIFSQHHVEWVVDLIGGIPYIGPWIQAPFSEYLENQKRRLHRRPGEKVVQSSSLLSWLFGQLLLIMIIYFILSIVNSMAQSFAKRRDEETVHQLLHPECHNTHHST